MKQDFISGVLVDSENNPGCPLPGPQEPFDINVDHESFNKLAQWSQQYGDAFTVTPCKRKQSAIVLNHPEHVRHVLIGNHKNYNKGVGFERVAMMLGNGIIVSDGQFWRAQRKMIQPAFHKSVIASQADMMQRCNSEKLRQWLDKAKTGLPINLTQEMSELALEVVLRSLFGSDLDRLSHEIGGNPFALLVEDVTRDLQIAYRFRSLTRYVQQIIDQRRKQQREEADFLSLLMMATDRDSGAPMPDKTLIDEIMTLIVAGHETTAGTLNWAWYLLSQHPQCEQRLQAEVDALNRDPVFEDLANLEYTRQVLDETLRLYPPVWLFSRKAIAADRLQIDTLGDGAMRIPGVAHADGSKPAAIEIAAGADIFVCPYLMHRDQRYWAEPETFEPNRFCPGNSKTINKHAYFPFLWVHGVVSGNFSQ